MCQGGRSWRDFSVSCARSSAASPNPLLLLLLIYTPPSSLLPPSALQFADTMSYGSKISVISMGQGQGPKAAALIATARKAGSWVLLQV